MDEHPLLQGSQAPVCLRIQVGAAKNSWLIWGTLQAHSLPSFCVPNCKEHIFLREPEQLWIHWES